MIPWLNCQVWNRLRRRKTVDTNKMPILEINLPEKTEVINEAMGKTINAYAGMKAICPNTCVSPRSDQQVSQRRSRIQKIKTGKKIERFFSAVK
jgi:hypothetical protein